MADLGDYIYFLIIIGSLIIGAFQQNGKKKRQDKANSSGHPQPVSREQDSLRDKIKEIQRRLESEIETISPSTSQPTPAPKPAPKSYRSKLDKRQNLESGPSLETNNSLELESQHDAAMNRIHKIQEKTTAETAKVTQKKESLILSKFNLRDAVIYSEIMNRKYTD